MKKDSFRLNKTVFKAMSFQEANDHTTYWLNKSLKERLDTACTIINQIFGVTPLTKIDRTKFSKRKFTNG